MTAICLKEREKKLSICELNADLGIKGNQTRYLFSKRVCVTPYRQHSCSICPILAGGHMDRPQPSAPAKLVRNVVHFCHVLNNEKSRLGLVFFIDLFMSLEYHKQFHFCWFFLLYKRANFFFFTLYFLYIYPHCK
jgi:hypothetical protein